MVPDKGRSRPIRRSSSRPSKPLNNSMNQVWELVNKYQKRYFNKQMLLNIVFNPAYTWLVASVLLIMEVFLNVWIIQKVKYTEIDWRAYMQEVEGPLNGTFDYSQLRGDTGPLVYPAGFVYVFAALHRLTSGGRNIRLAQYIFAGLYIVTLALVFRIYHKSKKVPPFVLALACVCSYRVHSIYVLRLFNDPVAVLFLYAALNCYIDGAWTAGSVFFSLGVSVKMNVLLAAPALLLAFLTSLGTAGTLLQLLVCAVVQVVLGAPFLLANPRAYIVGSFDLTRVFLHEWTVNWRFLPEDVFVHPYFHAGLLALHIILLAVFAAFHWYRCLCNFRPLRKSGVAVGCQLLLLPLFCSTLIGIAVSRSLHYQFYVWYFHSLPYLAWCTPMPMLYKLLVLGVLELCWNVFPSTYWSSALMHVCHLVLLVGIFMQRPSTANTKKVVNKMEKDMQESDKSVLHNKNDKSVLHKSDKSVLHKSDKSVLHKTDKNVLKSDKNMQKNNKEMFKKKKR